MAGSGAVRLLADQVGLTKLLSSALERRNFVPVHGRGRVLVDLATVLAAGGEAISDIDVLRHEPVWGAVASPATVWPTLEAIGPAALGRIGRPGRRSVGTCGPNCPRGCPPRRSQARIWGRRW